MPELLQTESTSSLRSKDGITPVSKREAVSGFAFLIAFFVVYCARPEDWIGPLYYIPLAKITAGGAMLSLLLAGKAKRKLSHLPREGYYLAGLIAVLFLSAFLSPVWRGGAFMHTVEFAKIIVIFGLVFLLVTSIERLRRLIFVQVVSMIVVTLVSMIKGWHTPRLEGVIGGIYSNANDLAFAIVLAIPFCLGFLITSKSLLGKIGWALGILIMLPALFMTASRAGFIDLLIAGTVCLWHFGVRGRRFYLIVATVFLGGMLFLTMGNRLMKRFEAISEATEGDAAYGSYRARKWLMVKALEGIEHYPVLGVGANNFLTYSGVWHPVHMTYLQIAVEGGIPALILYLLVFKRGFRNLRQLRKRKDLPIDYVVFVGAIHSSLIGFAVGALFSPEAYHFFPFFSVAYTSAMIAIVAERDAEAPPEPPSDWRVRRKLTIYGSPAKRSPLTVSR